MTSPRPTKTMLPVSYRDIELHSSYKQCERSCIAQVKNHWVIYHQQSCSVGPTHAHNTHTHTGGRGRGGIPFRQKKAAAFGGEATPPRTLRGHEEKKNVYLAVSSATLASVSRSKNSPIDCVLERERCMSVIECM